MGQKVNPISYRLQVNKDWRSKWFVDKRDYAKFLKNDLEVRRLIQTKLGSRASINKVEITRTPNLVTVTISTAKAGVVIGRGGTGAAELKSAIEKIYMIPVRVNIEELKNPAAPQHQLDAFADGIGADGEFEALALELMHHEFLFKYRRAAPQNLLARVFLFDLVDQPVQAARNGTDTDRVVVLAALRPAVQFLAVAD